MKNEIVCPCYLKYSIISRAIIIDIPHNLGLSTMDTYFEILSLDQLELGRLLVNH